MPNYVNVTFTNPHIDQHLYTITDDVIHQVKFDNQPLSGGESTQIALVVDSSGHGEATYGETGTVPTSRTDFDDGEKVDLN